MKPRDIYEMLDLNIILSFYFVPLKQLKDKQNSASDCLVLH